MSMQFIDNRRRVRVLPLTSTDLEPRGFYMTGSACRRCGSEPRAGARFCDACGSAIVGVETQAEHKQVTVLFADVATLDGPGRGLGTGAVA